MVYNININTNCGIHKGYRACRTCTFDNTSPASCCNCRAADRAFYTPMWWTQYSGLRLISLADSGAPTYSRNRGSVSCTPWFGEKFGPSDSASYEVIRNRQPWVSCSNCGDVVEPCRSWWESNGPSLGRSVMSGLTPRATKPTSGPAACTCGKILVSGWVWLVIAALNSKKSSGTAATGGVLCSDEIPTAVADARDWIGDNRFGSAEVVAVGGRVTTGDTAGGAITASKNLVYTTPCLRHWQG